MTPSDLHLIAIGLATVVERLAVKRLLSEPLTTANEVAKCEATARRTKLVEEWIEGKK